MSYKYYILENKNTSVQGVISDDEGKIVYEDLMITYIKNEFSGNNEPQLVTYIQNPARMCDANELVEAFDTVTITKDYWKALHHAGGAKYSIVH